MIDSGEACFDLGDAHSDLDTETVNVGNLLLHLMEARKYSALLLGVHLSHGVQGAMEPPPLAFHLTFQSRSSSSVLCKRVELPQPFPARVPRLFLL